MGQAAPHFRGKNHNHQLCIRQAINAAKTVCEHNEVRFTPLRQRVLEIIWDSHQPIVAYDILKVLRQEKQNAEPPTVYRALEFLAENRLIHKIESLNAFTGCNHPEKGHIGQFLICGQCGEVAEMEENEVSSLIRTKAEQHGFKVEDQTIEITGLCPVCAEQS